MIHKNPANYLSDCCSADVKYDIKHDWLVCLDCDEPCAGKHRTLGVEVEDKLDVKEKLQ